MTIHRQHRRSVPLSADAIGARIRIVRGQRVLLDEDLGRLYGVPTGGINQAVARNPARFPSDFAFPLTRQELVNLKSQTVISSWGGRRATVVAFTEQGVAMLSSVLRSPRAAEVNVAIMRAFVRLRRLLVDHAELAHRVAELEKKHASHDERIAAVFEAIRLLLQPLPPTTGERIGFNRPS
ncbi:MAG TPA: ORF6N domain-containing protein [Planctomycetota bacterium]|nr:ORF6N domain-containing protein [Planctomycetota bacterium]